jgi:hypothetical protein
MKPQCTPEKNLLKSCVDSAGFLKKMSGFCDDLKSNYEQCMALEYKKLKTNNLKIAKEKDRKWQQKVDELNSILEKAT